MKPLFRPQNFFMGALRWTFNKKNGTSGSLQDFCRQTFRIEGTNYQDTMPRNTTKDGQGKWFIHLEALIIWPIGGALGCYSERTWCKQQFEEGIWLRHAIPYMNTRCSMQKWPYQTHSLMFSMSIVHRCASSMYLPKETKIVANNAEALECMLWWTHALHQHWK